MLRADHPSQPDAAPGRSRPRPRPRNSGGQDATGGDEWAQSALLRWFEPFGAVTVAVSGGVDSAVVLAAAARASRSVTAVTAVSPALPAGMLAQARDLAARLGVTHRAIDTSEMAVEGYARNGADRCYFCKATLVDTVLAGPDNGGVLLTGTNADDVREGWRPGIRAARERGARTPLAELGLGKATVRALARTWGLPVWDQPASPCLSSRVAYGVRITSDRLARVDRAETAVRAALTASGVASRDLRVRDLGDSARVEVDPGAVSAAGGEAVRAAVRSAGFDGPVEVRAFRSGALNDALRPA